MRRGTCGLAGAVVAGLLASTPARADEQPAPEPAPQLVKRVPQAKTLPNDHIALMPIWSSEAFGLGVGYERAIARRVSVGAELDYLAQRAELSHLQGVQETVTLSVWPQRAFHGFLGRVSFSVGHQVFTKSPRISSTAIAPGIEVGWRFSLPRGFRVGLLAGLRWGYRVAESSGLCSAADHCPAIREGVYGRLGLVAGYAF